MVIDRFYVIGVFAFALIACSPSGSDADNPAGQAELVDSIDGAPTLSAASAKPAEPKDQRSVSQVVASLDRIEEIDRSGPTLQSVLSVNPDAREIASRLDEERAAGDVRGPLHGLPILIKDNIDTKDPIPTTAGSTALAANYAEDDAPLVEGLRAAGVVMLGKSNLSQWANFRSESSISGWSAIGGVTRNPHALDRSACGSSSGSGAAVAAGIVKAAIGTETNGSIICPASRNGIVGFKPTVGLVSQTGIIPISPSQDTAGPMTDSVLLAAQLLDAMDEVEVDYAAQLEGGEGLAGLRIGVMRFAEGDDAAISALFENSLSIMEEAGAELVDIEAFEYPDGFWEKAYRLLKIEFGPAMADYLSTTPEAVSVKTLEDLIGWNKAHADVELALFDQSIFEASVEEIALEDPEYPYIVSVLHKATRTNGIDALLSENEVDILVSPTGRPSFLIDPMNGDSYIGGVGATSLAAIAGYPHLTAPMGVVHDLPVGVSFIGAAQDDARVLAAGHAYEIRSNKMATPQFRLSVDRSEELSGALANKADRLISPRAEQPDQAAD